jgi:hypothetical protein
MHCLAINYLINHVLLQAVRIAYLLYNLVGICGLIADNAYLFIQLEDRIDIFLLYSVHYQLSFV